MNKAFTTKTRRTQTNIFGVEIRYVEGRAMYYLHKGRVYGFSTHEKHSIERRLKIAKNIANGQSHYLGWDMTGEDKKLFK